jgi:nucleotide-binding universal stress UspA family protein
VTVVLIATDFSDSAEPAHVQGVNLARRLGAGIVFTHVIPEMELAAAGMPAIADTVGAAIEEYRGRLAALCDRYGDTESPATYRVREGDPGAEISDLAQELEAEAVVVGTLGRTGLERFLLGSVAERVVRRAHTKVLVAQGDASGKGGYQDILVATDFSPAADRALTAAVAFAGIDARVELLHCWQPPATLAAFAGAQLIPGLEREARAEAEDAGRSRIAAAATDRVRIELSIVRGPPVPSIQEKLEERAFHLVAVGHGRRGRLGRLVAGSVAEKTVRHSPCSVLVVPEEAPESVPNQGVLP